jgi:hypothetical protein
MMNTILFGRKGQTYLLVHNPHVSRFQLTAQKAPNMNDHHNDHFIIMIIIIIDGCFQVAPIRLLVPLNKRRQDLNFMGSSPSLIILIIIFK